MSPVHLVLIVYVAGLLCLAAVLTMYEKDIDGIIQDKLAVGMTSQQLCKSVNRPRLYGSKHAFMTKKMMNDTLYKMMDNKQVAKTNHRKPIWVKIPRVQL
jgi:hypothetical protein